MPPYLAPAMEIAYGCRLRGIEVNTLTDAMRLKQEYSATDAKAVATTSHVGMIGFAPRGVSLFRFAKRLGRGRIGLFLFGLSIAFLWSISPARRARNRV